MSLELRASQIIGSSEKNVSSRLLDTSDGSMMSTFPQLYALVSGAFYKSITTAVATRYGASCVIDLSADVEPFREQTASHPARSSNTIFVHSTSAFIQEIAVPRLIAEEFRLLRCYACGSEDNEGNFFEYDHYSLPALMRFSLNIDGTLHEPLTPFARALIIDQQDKPLDRQSQECVDPVLIEDRTNLLPSLRLNDARCLALEVLKGSWPTAL